MTSEEAIRQADDLRLFHYLPWTLAAVVWRTVANPQAGPDTLLILADAIRETAQVSSVTEAADRLAELASRRPIPTAAPESLP